MKKQNRFSSDGKCNCALIDFGQCKQCSACDVCEYYRPKATAENTRQLYPWEYYWGGEIKTYNSMKYSLK